jgi:O-antigen/teichoic acid export membrane protein
MSGLSARDSARVVSLGGLALGHFLLTYGINWLLAHHLEPGDFDDFNVALSVLSVLSTIATLGLEKYALRCVPVYRERCDWGHLRGFYRFAGSATLASSCVLVAGAALAMLLIQVPGGHSPAFRQILFYLPVIAIALLAVELATANGQQLPAATAYRLLQPLLFVVTLGLLVRGDQELALLNILHGYGLAWLGCLGLLAWLIRRHTPDAAWTARPRFLVKKWVRRAAPLLMNSCMLSIMASSGVIILELNHPVVAEVGIYAVAAQTGTFIVLLTNTANRFYLPLVSLYLERHDVATLRRLLRHRLILIGGLVLWLGMLLVWQGRNILGWFGPSFTQGYEAMLVIAAGASVNALFSDSPYYLQFIKRSRDVFVTTAFAMGLNIVLTAALSRDLGMLGAAYGYSISMSLFFLVQRSQVSRHLRGSWRSSRRR